MIDGFLVVDKPAGMTSHDVVATVRKICRIKKVGHTGTLDPFATGVLPIALGEGTKAIPFLDESVKEYRAVMQLGDTTDTGDCTGTVIHQREWRHVDPSAIFAVTSSFTGVMDQIPPMFSALKRNGVPLYRLARQGLTVEREPRSVTIFSLKIERITLPEVAFSVRCSRGTYVRTLAADMGEMLGCGAHLVELNRTSSGVFNLSQALTVDHLKHMVAEDTLQGRVLSPYAALAHLRDLQLTGAGAAKVAVGALPAETEMPGIGLMTLERGEKVRLSFEGRLVAIAEQGDEEGRSLRIIRVFN